MRSLPHTRTTVADSKQCQGKDAECHNAAHKGCTFGRYCPECCPTPADCELKTHQKRAGKKHSAGAAAEGEASRLPKRLKTAGAVLPSASSSMSACASASSSPSSSSSSSSSPPSAAPPPLFDVKLEYLQVTALRDTKTEELEAKCLGRFIRVPTMHEGTVATAIQPCSPQSLTFPSHRPPVDAGKGRMGRDRRRVLRFGP